MMKRGFTIIEVLVASLLLGMLVSILTMMFNQSSIAWRTGVAAVEDLDEVRINIANLRDEADNAYVWNNQERRIIGGGRGTGGVKTYTVNVKSAGPDREFNTFDDIWSYPDEIN